MRTFIVGTILGFVFGGTVMDFVIAFASVEFTFSMLDAFANQTSDLG